jgi:hypothetical protein
LFDEQGTPCYISEECIDVTGNFPNPNPLVLKQVNNLIWTVSGVDYGWWRHEDYAVPWPGTVPYFEPASKPEPSDNSVLSSALSMTNPNTPKVDVPVFAAEIGDIPKLIKSLGDTILYLSNPSKWGVRDVRHLPRNSAKKYIEYQFGIEPLVRDVWDMLNFQALVDKKLRTLKNLGSVTNQRSSATVWSDVVTSGPWQNYATSMYQEHRLVYTMWHTTRKVWGSTIWKPSVPLPETDAEQRALAFRLAFGFGHLSFATFWEAMPWSWLFDWFGNVGDLLNLQRNEIPVTHGGSCVMRQTTAHRTFKSFSPTLLGDTCTLKIPTYNRSEKTRVVMGDASPYLEFSLPFLDGKQLSILSALLVTRLGS